MNFSVFSKKQFWKACFVSCGVGLLSACGEIQADKSISEEDSFYKLSEYPYEGEVRMEESIVPVPELGETLETAPLRKHHEIDFQMHWMHFDRPIMLFIDDPPGLNDSLFVH